MIPTTFPSGQGPTWPAGRRASVRASIEFTVGLTSSVSPKPSPADYACRFDYVLAPLPNRPRPRRWPVGFSGAMTALRAAAVGSRPSLSSFPRPAARLLGGGPHRGRRFASQPGHHRMATSHGVIPVAYGDKCGSRIAGGGRRRDHSSTPSVRPIRLAHRSWRRSAAINTITLTPDAADMKPRRTVTPVTVRSPPSFDPIEQGS